MKLLFLIAVVATATLVARAGGKETEKQRTQGATVRATYPFDKHADAVKLEKAMKGIGTDENAIIEVISKRTNQQRQEIAKEFKREYGKDLTKELKSEVDGLFEDLVVALMTPIDDFYASEVKHAISDSGSKETTLTEIIVSLRNAKITYIKDAYQKIYKKSMEEDVSSETSGNFKKLLRALLEGHRDETSYVDQVAVARDAQALREAGELKVGTDESTFNRIFSSRSFLHLKAVFAKYKSLSGKTIEKAIKSEFNDDEKQGLLAIVQWVENKSDFFAERLHDTMAGLGTRDRSLIRLIVTRSEIDLEDIKRAFQAKYGKSLESYIKEDTAGNYKKLLIALLG